MNTEFEECMRAFYDAKRSQQFSEPSDAHLSFIPKPQRSSVLNMTPGLLDEANMPTAFIGTITENYTNEMWSRDVEQWKKHYKEIQNSGSDQLYSEIKLLPLPERNYLLDSCDAILKIEKTLKELNKLPPSRYIRVICLGTAYASFLYEAITYLLQEWEEPDGSPRHNKFMQFITSGDTGKRDLSDFCQWLCIANVCQAVQFYNTQRYHPFGYCQPHYCQSEGQH